MRSRLHISLQAYADKQRAVRSHPFGDQCESAYEDQGKSDELEVVIIFKGNI